MASSDNKRLRRKVRRSYIISTISITLVLFLLGSVGFLIINAARASDKMRENMTVYIMLSDSLSTDRTKQLGEELKKEQGVKDVMFVSKDEAAREFKEKVGDDFDDFLDYNPLPNSFEVRFHANSTDTENLKEFENRVSAEEGVEEVVYERNVIDNVTRNINKFNLIVLLFGGALLVISLILLNNTIRLSIYAKRHLINTMKLVGATKWFIIRPFLVSSIQQGVVAGLLASGMFVAMIAGLGEEIPDIMVLAGNRPVIIILGAMILGGVIISSLFTIFAVNKFVNMNSAKIQLY